MTEERLRYFDRSALGKPSNSKYLFIQLLKQPVAQHRNGGDDLSIFKVGHDDRNLGGNNVSTHTALFFIFYI